MPIWENLMKNYQKVAILIKYPIVCLVINILQIGPVSEQFSGEIGPTSFVL